MVSVSLNASQAGLIKGLVMWSAMSGLFFLYGLINRYPDYLVGKNICKELNEYDWQRLPQERGFTVFKIFAPSNCKAVEEKINLEVTKILQDIANKMGAPNPDKFSVSIFNDWMDYSFRAIIVVQEISQVYLGSSGAYSLIGWGASFTPAEVRGVLAHEVAHAILGHIRQESGPNEETEADLLTLKVAEYARGLRDFLVHTCTGFDPFSRGICNNDESTHPALWKRVAYMTDRICEKYLEMNRDICLLVNITDKNFSSI